MRSAKAEHISRFPHGFSRPSKMPESCVRYLHLHTQSSAFACWGSRAALWHLRGIRTSEDPVTKMLTHSEIEIKRIITTRFPERSYVMRLQLCCNLLLWSTARYRIVVCYCSGCLLPLLGLYTSYWFRIWRE